MVVGWLLGCLLAFARVLLEGKEREERKETLAHMISDL